MLPEPVARPALLPWSVGWRWAVPLLLLAALFIAFQFFDLGHGLSFQALKARRQSWQTFAQAQPVAAFALLFVTYVLATSLSLPGAGTVLTLAAGALFGLGWGVLLVSFASSLGALGAFLSARYLLRDRVQSRFGAWLGPLNDGLRRDGVWTLLCLRLVPLVPYFVVNLLAGLTALPAWRYYWATQLGMLAGTVVYVNAGTQLAALSTPADVLSPALLGSLLLLGLLPLLARVAIGHRRRR